MEKQQPYAKKVRLHIEQRNEWLRSLQASMMSQIETMLREFYKAAVICHKRRPELSVDDAYIKLIERSRLWSDEDVLKEFGERRSDDAEICLHEAIKEHAKVLSLSTATPCRTPLDVPSILKFFRSVLATSAEELCENGLEIFGTTDISLRKRIREWIGDIIVHKALEIVPISKFAGRSAPPPPPEIIAPEIIAEEVKALPISPPPPPLTVVPPIDPVITQVDKKEEEDVVISTAASSPKRLSDEDAESEDADSEDEDEDEDEDEEK